MQNVKNKYFKKASQLCAEYWKLNAVHRKAQLCCDWEESDKYRKIKKTKEQEIYLYLNSNVRKIIENNYTGEIGVVYTRFEECLNAGYMIVWYDDSRVVRHEFIEIIEKGGV